MYLVQATLEVSRRTVISLCRYCSVNENLKQSLEILHTNTFCSLNISEKMEEALGSACEKLNPEGKVEVKDSFTNLIVYH